MLGRQNLTVDENVSAFRDLCSNVFVNPRREPFDGQLAPLFRTKQVEIALQATFYVDALANESGFVRPTHRRAGSK